MVGGAAAVGAMITLFASAASPAAPRAAAVAMFLHGTAVALTLAVSGRIGDRYGHARLALAGSALSLSAVLVLATGPSEAAWAIGAILLGVGFAAQQNGTRSLMLARATPSEADGVTAVWNIAYDAGLGLGALAFGCVCTRLGGSAAVLGIAILIAAVTMTGVLGGAVARRGSFGARVSSKTSV
jgi:predicted MFS family arabinose efflux permease